tara:strand:+ start:209 stop:397 length:189 start_codon:yes stop_codon:yes gene_type:complete
LFLDILIQHIPAGKIIGNDSLIGFCRPAKSIRGMFLLGRSQLFDLRLTDKKSFLSKTSSQVT